MTSHDSHHETRLSLGAYALGSLEPADQALVESHLVGCPECLSELAELEAVVPVLAGLSREDLEAPRPSPDLFARIATAIDTAGETVGEPDVPTRDERAGSRSRRWLVAVAASIVLLAGAGTAVGITLSHRSSSSTTASASAPRGIHLQVTATDASVGTRLVLTAQGLPTHEHCHLVAVAADGSHHDAGTWNASYQGKASVVEHTSVPRSQLRHLTLYGNAGRKLVGVDL